MLRFIQRASSYLDEATIILEATPARPFGYIRAYAISRAYHLFPNSILFKLIPRNYDAPYLVSQFLS